MDERQARNDDDEDDRAVDVGAARGERDDPEVIPPLGEGPGIEVLGFVEIAEAIPALGKLLYRLVRDPRVPPLPKVLGIASAVYLLSPVDLVPDNVPVLGKIDDAVVLLLAIDWLLVRTDESILAEHWDGDVATLRALRNTLVSLGRFWPERLLGLIRSRRAYKRSETARP